MSLLLCVFKSLEKWRERERKSKNESQNYLSIYVSIYLYTYKERKREVSVSLGVCFCPDRCETGHLEPFHTSSIVVIIIIKTMRLPIEENFLMPWLALFLSLSCV